MNRNLCKTVLSQGGSIIPLLISPEHSKGLGLMNPSILIDKGRILLNLRNINYTLYHCEGEQLFNNRWGPLSYLHPEHDMHLRTYNFMCELNIDSLEIKNYCLTDTSTFDKPPLWEFVGLEDARLVRWDDKLYQCGVRRDTTPNGVGRMELSEIEEVVPETGKCKWKEISRTRIEPPGPPTYCEKNWMPVLDMPFHFVKWCNPTQVVKVNLETKQSETVYLGKNTIEGYNDFRGGSQVLKWKDYRIALLHEVNLFKNKLQQKDARYTHRFITWDKDWNIVKISDSFSLMDGEIEFGCGLTFYQNDILITFGFQDNAAYILRIPEHMIEEVLGFTKNKFDWGKINENSWLKGILNEQSFVRNGFQRYFSVEKNDVVVDIGADVGSFSYLISNKNPKKVFSVEENKDFFPTLFKNTRKNSKIICSNKKIDNSILKYFFESYKLDKINFLKINCNGKEYDIFNDDNLKWIKSNVEKITGIWNLSNKELKNKFIHFRDTYLKEFPDFNVTSIDGVDIKWDLYNDHFMNYYGEVMIHIDNRPREVKEPKIQLLLRNFDAPKQDLNAKWKSSKWPTLEITTNIPEKGCPINCVFCPQKVLQNAYKGERMLSLDGFKKIIDKVPKDVTIIFSGFSEPWVNKFTTDMVLYAKEKGHSVAIFTTGIGMTKTDVDKLKDIRYSLGAPNPLIGTNGLPMQNGGFILHLPDNEGYSKHSITKRYIELLKYIKSIKDDIVGFKVICMGSVHDKVKDIFPTAESITLWSRANNLVKEEKLKPELKKLSSNYNKIYQGESPITCSCDEELYHNVLLPNGDVVLCCMDYNLDHVLGNLYTQEYNDILPILKTPFELCRYCENGIPVNLKL